MTSLVRLLLAAITVSVLFISRSADACGCFAAPPVVTTPVIQAGERIFFAARNGRVIAHIQIQYSGDAKDFGWLLPLPSVPVLKAGTDELFTQLEATTAPRFVLSSGTTCQQGLGFGCGARSPQARLATEEDSRPPETPLVFLNTVGPYEAAVLKADNKDALIAWLSANRFVVPTTSDAALAPYLNPGAYFVALKLRSGKTAGDLTPIIVEYESELPMIPITLTSIGATPNMGIQVFLAGNGRAVPRNYRHVVVNDALLNWVGGANDYQALVTRAVAEAPDRQAFVTDFAGSTQVMRDVLAPPSRFGVESTLARETTPDTFILALWQQGFGLLPPVREPNRFRPEPEPEPEPRRFPPALEGIVLEAVPVPPAMAMRGVTAERWLAEAPTFLSTRYRQDNPLDFVGYSPPPFDAPALTRRIFTEYVSMVRDTNFLFSEFPTLTRLFTTLSPEDMTRDPVFGFNPSLPEVPRERQASSVTDCNGTNPRVVTDQGWVVPTGMSGMNLPAALRVETLPEEGSPVVTLDNETTIRRTFQSIRAGQGGCSTVADPVMVGLFALVASWRRRRGLRSGQR
jgi:hypothetical protein